MREWIAEYVQIARTCRKFGRKKDAKRWMSRARGLKSYLDALDQRSAK